MGKISASRRCRCALVGAPVSAVFLAERRPPTLASHTAPHFSTCTREPQRPSTRATTPIAIKRLTTALATALASLRLSLAAPGILSALDAQPSDRGLTSRGPGFLAPGTTPLTHPTATGPRRAAPPLALASC